MNDSPLILPDADVVEVEGIVVFPSVTTLAEGDAAPCEGISVLLLLDKSSVEADTEDEFNTTTEPLEVKLIPEASDTPSGVVTASLTIAPLTVIADCAEVSILPTETTEPLAEIVDPPKTSVLAEEEVDADADIVQLPYISCTANPL